MVRGALAGVGYIVFCLCLDGILAVLSAAQI